MQKSIHLLILIIAFSVTAYLNGGQIDQNFNESSWSMATRSGNVDLIIEHLEEGFDINTRDSQNGNTALMNVVESGNINAVELLILAGADINEVTGPYKFGGPSWPKRCALTSAFRFPEILEFLIDSGANIEIKLIQKRTPLHYAAEAETTYEALCILLKNGANVNAKDLYNKTPLHSGINSNKIAFSLLDNGADLHAVDHEGYKPLHLAYVRNDMVLLKELVRRGAPLDESSSNGGNALHRACGGFDFDLIKFLIEEQKMNVNEPSKWFGGNTGAPNAFMYAVGSQKYLEDDFEILNYLVSRGADLNAKVFYDHGNGNINIKYSVLTYAKKVQKVPPYIIEWLIENGAK